MFSQRKFLFSFVLFAVFSVPSVFAECPNIEGNWVCEDGRRFRFAHETVNGYDVFTARLEGTNFIYTVSDDGSIPMISVVSRRRATMDGLGASCFVNSDNQPVFRVGLHSDSLTGSSRLLQDYSVTEDDQLSLNLHFVRDTTSAIKDINTTGGRNTLCNRR